MSNIQIHSLEEDQKIKPNTKDLLKDNSGEFGWLALAFLKGLEAIGYPSSHRHLSGPLACLSNILNN